MFKLSNNTLQKFLDCFIEVIKEENRDRKQNYGDSEINIPFILSSLYQSMNNDIEKYKEFIQNLEEYPDYDIYITKSRNDYDGIIDVDINLYKFHEQENDDEDYDPYVDYDCPNYNYLLSFSYDKRYYGYCQCTPDMPDYRKDKHCCGHGCDASFCSFSLHKVLNVVSDSWHGDEHDYWEFEDEFYASDKELADKKKEEDRVREIEELKNRISADSKRLAELTSGDFPVDVDKEV